MKVSVYTICLSVSEVMSLKEESSNVQSLKDEFTQRIADAERKAQLACKERDIAKKVMLVLVFLGFINVDIKVKSVNHCHFPPIVWFAGDKRFAGRTFYETKLL